MALDAGGQGRGLCRASRLVIAENQTLFCVDSDKENSVVRGHIMHRSAVPVYEQRTIYQQQQASGGSAPPWPVDGQVPGHILRNFSGCTISKVHV